MAKNLKVNKLDFDELKENLIHFLQGQEKFKDYNFYGSGFDVILDALSYNSFYMGTFAHLLANETFIDSANLRESLTSKAKLLNYIPKSSYSAISDVNIKLDINNINEPIDEKFLIERGLFAQSINDISGQVRSFILIDDIFVYNKSITTSGFDYSSDTIQMYEGEFQKDYYTKDITQNSTWNQVYRLTAKNVDYRTIRIKVYDNDTSSSYTSYKLASDFMLINELSPVFFITTDDQGYYEIVFGNGVYGHALENGNYIEISYVENSGELGNDAREFTYTGEDLIGADTQPVSVTINTETYSDGGRGEETLEELKFNIPHHYKRQNRLVTKEDYKSIMLSEYNNIQSINVWGGEDNYPKMFGQVFISIKPKIGNILSSKAKQSIQKNILDKYNVVTIETTIIDVDFLYLNIENHTKFNPLMTDKGIGEITNLIDNTIKSYDETQVSKFDGYYSNATLYEHILNTDSSIISTFQYITLEKKIQPSLETSQSYTIDFNGKIEPNSILSDGFIFRGLPSYFNDDGNGNIKIHYISLIDGSEYIYESETFGEIDYDVGIINTNNIIIDSIINGDKLIVKSTPIEPDFYPLRNNIIKINNISITVTEYDNK